MLNGATDIRMYYSARSGAHEPDMMPLVLQATRALKAGENVQLQGNFRVAGGSCFVDHTSKLGVSVDGYCHYCHEPFGLTRC